MIPYEAIKLTCDLFKKVSALGIKMDDYERLPLYEDYETMANEGLKLLYIVTILSTKYKMSKRSIYRVVRRFNELCQELATERNQNEE